MTNATCNEVFVSNSNLYYKTSKIKYENFADVSNIR